jgi:hypothetical protein
MAELLADDGGRTRYVSGCIEPGKFYETVSTVVLLSSRRDVTP